MDVPNLPAASSSGRHKDKALQFIPELYPHQSFGYVLSPTDVVCASVSIVQSLCHVVYFDPLLDVIVPGNPTYPLVRLREGRF
jgi:hypothetical protein